MSICWLGIDGCKSGWVVSLLRDDGHINLFYITALTELEEVFKCHGEISAIGIDIPIGLADHAERGGRGCDREARKILSAARREAVSECKKRSAVPFVGPSSIFTPPTRPALIALSKGASHSEISQVNVDSSIEGGKEGLGLSIQAFHIMPKIKEADECLSALDETAATALQLDVPIFECHPEVAFLALTMETIGKNVSREFLFGTRALLSKKHLEGRRQRLLLLRDHCGLDLALLYKLTQKGEEAQNASDDDDCLKSLCQKQTWRINAYSSASGEDEKRISVAADDVIDAIVCAHSARRWTFKQSVVICEDDSQCIDSRGLPMLIQV